MWTARTERAVEACPDKAVLDICSLPELPCRTGRLHPAFLCLLRLPNFQRPFSVILHWCLHSVLYIKSWLEARCVAAPPSGGAAPPCGRKQQASSAAVLHGGRLKGCTNLLQAFAALLSAPASLQGSSARSPAPRSAAGVLRNDTAAPQLESKAVVWRDASRRGHARSPPGAPAAHKCPPRRYFVRSGSTIIVPNAAARFGFEGLQLGVRGPATSFWNGPGAFDVLLSRSFQAVETEPRCSATSEAAPLLPPSLPTLLPSTAASGLLGWAFLALLPLMI